ncbi:HAMP domain-containing sensor histidine kinase [uncultured Aureimonas sp.]|uniref:sensor histidine kinase n=1 Tax=uncultured Aureimonas sp. TaxID=1604662 RepID=UPI0025E90BF0|nr:HAMP domain-containing sensor histidine kinase [uncultured Aureimonas sp.]
MNAWIDGVLAWFAPGSAGRSRSENEMIRVFVFTHLFGPIIAQPMGLFLIFTSPSVDAPLVIMIAAICSFWTLPFLLRATGDIKLASFLSFELLTATALFGTFFYGGFSSPFLPWLIVALLLGLFYHGERQRLILMVFALDIMIFLMAAEYWGLAPIVPTAALRILGWLSIAAATVYMSWMAIYYASVTALRDEMETEAERYRLTVVELEKARSAAERSSQARRRFFSKMSHELRTPLNAIIGFSEILLEECDMNAPSADTKASDIRKINMAGRHLLSLVSDVLNLDGEGASQQPVKPSRFTLRELCDDVVANTQPLVEKNGNRLVLICPNASASVTTDRTVVRQMLLNLLSNAAKFTANGTIQLSVTLNGGAENTLTLAVTDSGIGMRKEALSRIFADYEQAELSTSSRYGGTGLGLSLTKRQAILLGGEISVASKHGEGSCFTIRLPAHLDAEPRCPEPDTPSPLTRPGAVECAA